MRDAAPAPIGGIDPETLTRQFGRCVIVQVTAQCPLECAHCIVESSPTRTEQLSTEALTRLIEDIGRDGRTDLVVFSGGEPFLSRTRLITALNTVAAAGLKAGIVTSGSWATTQDRARSVLGSLPLGPLADLAFSADRHHEPFLDMAHVRRGIDAALERDVPVSAFICVDGPQDDFLDRFQALLGAERLARIRLRVTRTHRAGRARTQPGLASLEEQVPLDALPDAPCMAPAAPSVCPDGRVMACCGDTVSDPDAWSALTLGQLARDGYGAMLDRADDSLLIQALRVYGPKYLAQIAEGAGALKNVRADRNNICDICRTAVTDPKALEVIMEHLQRPDSRDDIMVHRTLMYGEGATSARKRA